MRSITVDVHVIHQLRSNILYLTEVRKKCKNNGSIYQPFTNFKNSCDPIQRKVMCNIPFDSGRYSWNLLAAETFVILSKQMFGAPW
jgi:hypothetical protein